MTTWQANEVRRIAHRHGPLCIAEVGGIVTVGIQSVANVWGERKLIRELDLDARGRVLARRDLKKDGPGYDVGDGSHGFLRAA